MESRDFLGFPKKMKLCSRDGRMNGRSVRVECILVACFFAVTNALMLSRNQHQLLLSLQSVSVLCYAAAAVMLCQKHSVFMYSIHVYVSACLCTLLSVHLKPSQVGQYIISLSHRDGRLS